MGLGGRFQQCRSQLGIRHTHCFNFVQSGELTNVHFVLEVVPAKLYELGSGVNVMLTVEHCLLQFGFRQGTINVEWDGCLLHGETQVTFDCLEG